MVSKMTCHTPLQKEAVPEVDTPAETIKILYLERIEARHSKTFLQGFLPFISYFIMIKP